MGESDSKMEKMQMAVRTIIASSFLVALVSAHGMLVNPRPRNSIDHLANVNDPSNRCSNLTGDACTNGQSAFYYSQGCFIGCAECDHASGRRQTDLCGSGMKSTNNGPARSLNLVTTPGVSSDIYRHNPWRAPGSAPVADVCGYAGGTPYGQNGPEAGDYINTSYAHHGMAGSTLPPMPTGTEWKIGGQATVSWNVRNNHGGGYSYRLCPASEPLTESCFQKHPLDFVQDKQAILFPDGHSVPINGTFVTEGTFPEGSMWARLPIPATGLGPRCLPGPNDTAATPNGCMEWEGRSNYNAHVNGPCVACPETPGSDCSRCSNPGSTDPKHPVTPPTPGTAFPPLVPGVAESPIHNVLDVLVVPAHLSAGDYVLGWRYDCEGTAQVWSNCADISLV